jgi:hypothetical protein
VLVGDTLCEPLVALVPVQPPLAVQVVALVVDQVSRLDWPDVMVVGLAVSVTVGGAGVVEIVTVADALSDPPMPVQVSV